VLASRDEETVGYWTLPEHHGVEIAFFLQFHDSDDQALAMRKGADSRCVPELSARDTPFQTTHRIVGVDC